MQKNLKPVPLIKILLSTFVIFLCFNCLQGQEKETEFKSSRKDSFADYKQSNTDSNIELKESSTEKAENGQDDLIAIEPEQKKISYKFIEVDIENNVKEKFVYKTLVKHFPEGQAPQVELERQTSQVEKEKFHWKYALIESGFFLGFQHGFRMMQEKTRRELGGPFFRDWGQSVRNLRGWKDSDNLFTNYIAHPGQGAITGRIFINNSDRAKKQEFGKSKKYWESRLKAMAWSAIWSTQFELGPISEASIGNVGLHQKNGHSTMAYVDLVMTPVAGTGLVIAEDAIDKYFLRNWLEKKTDNKFVINMSRSLINPTTSIANLLRLKMPWYRRKR